MKKILSMLVLVALLCTMFACKEPEPETPTEVTYKLGIGVVVENEATAADKASSEVTAATVLLDENGKIVVCRIDAIQVNNFSDADGVVNTTKTYQTKMELGDNYNMVTYGGATAEWYEQAKAFEAYVAGKTVSEVESITVGEDGKTTLVAGCTIAVTPFIEAIAKACKDTHAVSFKTEGVPTLGVSLVASVEDKTKDESKKAEVAVDCGASAVVNGKVVAATLDCAASTFTFGETVSIAFNGTKRELGDNYNMVTYGGAVAEWYVQAQKFADATVGKNSGEIAAITVGEDGKTTLVAGCTIMVDAFKAVLEKATAAVR